MGKYRIISEQSIRYNNELAVETFYIQRKYLFFWKTIINKEDVKEYTPSFETYKLAEEYLFKNYFSDGEVEKSGNIYSFNKYTYYV